MERNHGEAGAAPPTAAICRALALDPGAEALLDEDVTATEFLTALIEEERYADAARYLASLMPRRNAVVWACLCARSVAGDDTSAATERALAAAETWVRDPVQSNAEAAKAAADATELDSAAALAALAAYFSGESLAPADLPPVPPPPDLTGQGVAAAVMLGASAAPEEANERYRAFLAKGIEISRKAALGPVQRAP